MSEYLSKKAVLEHIRREIGITERQQDAVMTRHMKEFHGGAIRALQNFEHAVQSSAFDAEQMKNYEDFLQNYEDFQRKYEHYQTEVQRLRAALVEIKQLLNENRENDGAFQSWNHMQAWKVATQALSTTTEPTGAERVIGLRAWDKELEMFHDEVVAIDFRLRKIRVFSRSEDDYPSDWLPLERFVLYGINAPEGEGNDA